jgi:hypothetical protein
MDTTSVFRVGLFCVLFFLFRAPPIQTQENGEFDGYPEAKSGQAAPQRIAGDILKMSLVGFAHAHEVHSRSLRHSW